MQIRGKVKGVKATIDGSGLTKRELTLTFADDAVLDELQELMKGNQTLIITLEAQQLRLNGTRETDLAGTVRKR